MKVVVILLACLAVSVSTVPINEAEFKNGFLNFLNNFLTTVVLPPVVTAVQDTAVLAAQITAGISEGGLDAIIGLFGGKREINEAELRGILDFLNNFLTQVILPPVVTAVQDTAVLAAQITAGISEGGLDAIIGLFGGKREINEAELKDIWSDLLNQLTGQLTSQLGNILPSLLQQILQGKREINVAELRGVWDDLLNAITSGATNIANQLTQQLGLTLTQALLQISQGKRNAEDFRGVWDNIVSSLNLNNVLDTVTNGATNIANQLTQQLGLTLTQVLLQLSQGKRNAEDFRGVWEDLLNAITSGATNIANQLTQQLGLTLTQVLLQISQGKRQAINQLSDFLSTQVNNIVNQVLGPAIQNATQQAAALLAQLTATVAIDGLPGLMNILNGIGK